MAWVDTFYQQSVPEMINWIRKNLRGPHRGQFPAAIPYTSPTTYQVSESRRGVSLEAVYPRSSPSVLAEASSFAGLRPDLGKLLEKQKKLYEEENGRIAAVSKRYLQARLDFQVQLLDPEARDEILWEGKAFQMLRDNDNAPSIEEALHELASRRRGEWRMVGGGAEALWKIKRVS